MNSHIINQSEPLEPHARDPYEREIIALVWLRIIWKLLIKLNSWTVTVNSCWFGISVGILRILAVISSWYGRYSLHQFGPCLPLWKIHESSVFREEYRSFLSGVWDFFCIASRDVSRAPLRTNFCSLDRCRLGTFKPLWMNGFWGEVRALRDIYFEGIKHPLNALGDQTHSQPWPNPSEDRVTPLQIKPVHRDIKYQLISVTHPTFEQDHLWLPDLKTNSFQIYAGCEREEQKGPMLFGCPRYNSM